VFDNLYATSRQQVEQHLSAGHPVILEIDWQGAAQVRQSMPECVTIFILPPSLAELERRLRDRRTDSEEVIERRLRDARGDISHWQEFDYVVINDDLDQALADLESVLAGHGSAQATSNEALRTAVQQILP
jgi:guanylate kinase